MHLVNTVSAFNEPIPFFNAEIGVIYELYTPQNPVEVQILRTGDLHRWLDQILTPAGRLALSFTDGTQKDLLQEVSKMVRILFLRISLFKQSINIFLLFSLLPTWK